MKYINLALTSANSSKMIRSKIGAVIKDSKGNLFLGKNVQYVKSCMHAEMDALTRYLKHYGVFHEIRKFHLSLNHGGRLRYFEGGF